MSNLRARAAPSEVGQECAARPALDLVRERAGEAAQALAAIEAPLIALARRLEDILDDDADELATGERARIEGALRGLDRRARMHLPAWRAMLTAIAEDAEDDPDFVDWFDATFLYGRVVDAACRRHWVDPTEPLHAAVLAPAHGVLVTSATLADSTLEDPFALAEMRDRRGALCRASEDTPARFAVRLCRECARAGGDGCGSRRSPPGRRRHA